MTTQTIVPTTLGSNVLDGVIVTESGGHLASAGVAFSLAQPTDTTVKFLISPNRDFIHVKNTGSSATVTVVPIATVGECNMGGTHNFVQTIGGSAEKTFTIPYADKYIDSDGYVTLTYSTTTGITAGYFRMPVGL